MGFVREDLLKISAPIRSLNFSAYPLCSMCRCDQPTVIRQHHLDVERPEIAYAARLHLGEAVASKLVKEEASCSVGSLFTAKVDDHENLFHRDGTLSQPRLGVTSERGCRLPVKGATTFAGRHCRRLRAR